MNWTIEQLDGETIKALTIGNGGMSIFPLTGIAAPTQIAVNGSRDQVLAVVIAEQSGLAPTSVIALSRTATRSTINFTLPLDEPRLVILESGVRLFAFRGAAPTITVTVITKYFDSETP